MIIVHIGGTQCDILVQVHIVQWMFKLFIIQTFIILKRIFQISSSILVYMTQYFKLWSLFYVTVYQSLFLLISCVFVLVNYFFPGSFPLPTSGNHYAALYFKNTILLGSTYVQIIWNLSECGLFHSNVFQGQSCCHKLQDFILIFHPMIFYYICVLYLLSFCYPLKETLCMCAIFAFSLLSIDGNFIVISYIVYFKSCYDTKHESPRLFNILILLLLDVYPLVRLLDPW